MPVEHFRQHPDVHQPWAEWSEAQTLHLVLVYNNPFRWQSRRKLFNDCVRHMLSQPNLRVYCVELAYGDRPFEVTDREQADFVNGYRSQRVDIQLRTSAVMWHKENLVNLGVRHFPSTWQYGGYFDADFTCTRHDWALETVHMLQHHHFAQLFSSYTDLSGHQAHSFQGSRPYRMTSSFASNFLHQREFRSGWERKQLRGKSHMIESYGVRMPKGDVFPFGMPPGATGGGWAWRRAAFDRVGGLLDTCILGSGDWHMAFGLAGLTNVAAEMKRCTRPYMNKVLQWQARAGELRHDPNLSTIGCVDQHVIHQFHGSKSRRQYGDRWQILRDHAFDPDSDLTRDWQGVWGWVGNKPGLRDDVSRYFLTRIEDDPLLRSGEEPLV